MLAELAACNAAFAVIKATLVNGRQLVDAGQALIDYFGNQKELQKKHNQKKSSKFASSSSALEEFLALEELKKQEEELKELMIWHGRANMWQDWLQFRADYHRRIREEEEAEKRAALLKRQKQLELVEYSIAAVIVAATVWGIYQFAVFIINAGGYA
jgi:hypothetical protein